MKDDLFGFLKGFAMGAANVIPGVSGGTIAFITGIYERLIEAIKGFDLTTLRLAAKFRFREAAERVDLRFLVGIGLGVMASVLSLAKVLKWAMESSSTTERALWAFFFGLILASLPAVGKMVRRWSVGPVLVLLLGAAVAVAMAFLSPASENTNPLYLTLCGVVAMCSMIIPGLSGSLRPVADGELQADHDRCGDGAERDGARCGPEDSRARRGGGGAGDCLSWRAS